MKIKKIAVVGMRQSGSTALYNMIRYIFTSNDIAVYGEVDDEYDPLCKKAQASPVHIRKGHAYSSSVNEWSDYIFVTKRDLRDSVASSIRKKGKPIGDKDIIAHCHRLIEAYSEWEKYANYIFSYELFMKNPESVISEVLGILGVSCASVSEINDWLQYLFKASGKRLKKIGYDEIRLTRRFITNKGRVGGYKKTLSSHESKLIRKEFNWWYNRERHSGEDG
jgi:hypothetical protein